MDRYWENAGAKNPPPVPTATQGTYPTDGNLPAAVAPSTPGAWWYHQITEEIRNAIVRLGGTPTFTQVDQLANAILASISSAVSGVTEQLAKVAYSGSYNDLSSKPVIPAAQVNSDWNAGSGVAMILNRPNLARVATSGSYTDLSNTPAIPPAQVNSDWNASSGVAAILNKPDISGAWTTSNLQPLNVNGIGYVTFIVLNGNSSQSATEGTVMALPGRPGSWLSCGNAGSGGDYWCVWTRIA